MPLPICFVLMPFGRKPGAGGKTIDFDAVYEDLIAPAIVAAGFESLRADEEQAGGIIHRPMFERLILCEYAIADLTTANANVFYELGVRHAVKPASTVLIFAQGVGPLPFDVAPLRGLPYSLGVDGKPGAIPGDRDALRERLVAARHKTIDSPLFQLVDGFPDIQRLKTDVFRDRVDYARQMKQRLAEARKAGVAAVRAIGQEMEVAPGGLADAEAGVVVDLFLSFRAVKAWGDMIELVGRMARPLAQTVLIQEQLGFALNRAGRGDEAERTLLELIERRGASSETCGILGRVFKDRWEAAAKAGSAVEAAGWLRKAIGAYLRGFEADWRDAYPGINAATLMELSDPPDSRSERILPVVAYALERRIAAGKPDYWDHATRLELAVLAKEERVARDALGDALAAVRETWEPETTARNLRLIREAREARGTQLGWATEIEQTLLHRAARTAPPGGQD